MAKKSSKSSKIKSTKVDKEALLANKKNKSIDEQNLENINNNDSDLHFNNEQDVINQKNEEQYDDKNFQESSTNDVKNESEIIKEAKQVTKQLENEDVVIDNKQQQELIEKLLNENIQLQNTINLLNEKNEKLKITLETERQQLIEKLEEKTALAKQQLEEKMIKIEQEKQDELLNIKDSVYMDVVSNFLEPFLLFEKTVTTPVQNEIVRSYVEGYHMVVSMFKEALNNLNIQQILVNVGDEFNAEYMEAFDVEEVPGTPPNRVTKVVSKGFIYKDKILKYTSVVVSK